MLIPFDELFARHHVKPVGVLHLGANTGQEAETYHKFGIPKVVWVEALPDICLKLKEHLAPYPQQLALCACLSEVDGKPVAFNISNNEAQSSSFLEFGTHTTEHPTVRYIGQMKMKTTRVDTLLRQNGINLANGWFLNIDLQGAELLALKGMGNLIRFFKWAYIEVNTKQLYKGCPFVTEIDAYLAPYGFVGKECKMTGNGWGDKFYARVC